MSSLLPAAAAAAAATPLAAGWSAHAVLLRRRLAAAGRDPLTGLLRRDGFQKRAARMLRKHASVGVLVIDLDGFKRLNDEFGHAAGDIALATTGRRLVDHVAAHGIAARLGGDEFAAVLSLPTDGPGLPFHVAELHSAICSPLPIDGHVVPLGVGASIGAAYSSRHPGAGLSGLLRRADEAMYAVKRSGGGWLIAHAADPTHPTVNGRRSGRPGTHASCDDSVGGAR
ncbi:GGDEF domain-containing protein [Streptomyces sp. B6B3]|uniref:GGDEF domain-containing protein n=1 Tax=Streptomyces sp. B6B3 TaxID=3153570 RepID=UPI00325C677D